MRNGLKYFDKANLTRGSYSAASFFGSGVEVLARPSSVEVLTWYDAVLRYVTMCACLLETILNLLLERACKKSYIKISKEHCLKY